AGRMSELREEGALDEVRRSTELADQLFAEKPDVIDIRMADAMEHHGLAELLARSGDVAGALAHARKEVQLRETLLLNPADTRPRVPKGIGYMLIGNLEMRRHNRRDAVSALRTAVGLFTPLHEEHKLDPQAERALDHAKQMLAESERIDPRE